MLERILTVQVTLKGASFSDIRKKIERLNEILNTDKPVPIVFADEPDRSYYGILDGEPDWFEVSHIAQGTIQFICPDPYKYGATRSQLIHDPSGDPEANPIIEYTGTAPTYPTFDITLNVASPDLTILNGADMVRLIWDFVADDRVHIDFTKRKIFINENLRMTAYDVRQSQWFSLQPGDNQITITPNVGATIRYTERWL